MEVVEQFKYLGSLVEACGGVVGEVSCRIAQASGAIGSLCDSVFTASDFTMHGDQEDGVPICSVGVLLYAAMHIYGASLVLNSE